MHIQIAPRNSSDDSSSMPNHHPMTRHFMSSRAIAGLTGKNHFHVRRDILSMLADLKEDASKLGCIYLEAQNRKQTEYLLDREHTDCLLTGYSAELRMKVIRRWRELESQAQQQSIPKTYVEALRLAADKAEENERLLGVILLQAPKVAAIRRLAAAEGAICITDAAKQLHIAPSKLFTWLQANRWIFHRGSSTRWIAYQPLITAGLMVHKVTQLKPDFETGADRAAYQPLITPKGLACLAEKNIGASL